MVGKRRARQRQSQSPTPVHASDPIGVPGRPRWPRASQTKPDRNLALELVRVTEAAALAAARWVGRGDKIAADQAAVDAMRFVLDTVPMDGTS